jgi:hypothetical protein
MCGPEGLPTVDLCERRSLGGRAGEIGRLFSLAAAPARCKSPDEGYGRTGGFPWPLVLSSRFGQKFDDASSSYFSQMG